MLGWLTSPELKIPKIPIFNLQKLNWNWPTAQKTPRKWRDLGESFSQHIYFFLIPILSQKNLRRKSATKVKNQGCSMKMSRFVPISKWNQMIFCSEHNFFSFENAPRLMIRWILYPTTSLFIRYVISSPFQFFENFVLGLPYSTIGI